MNVLFVYIIFKMYIAFQMTGKTINYLGANLRKHVQKTPSGKV